MTVERLCDFDIFPFVAALMETFFWLLHGSKISKYVLFDFDGLICLGLFFFYFPHYLT